MNKTYEEGYIAGFNHNIEVVKELEEQQKEFIKFLESMWEETQDIWYIKILSKYKEIIGGND